MLCADAEQEIAACSSSSSSYYMPMCYSCRSRCRWTRLCRP